MTPKTNFREETDRSSSRYGIRATVAPMSDGRHTIQGIPVDDHTPRPPDQTETICHVVHSLGIGGAEVLARDFARRIMPNARKVFACLDREGEMAHELRAEGFRVEMIGRSIGFDLSCARRLRQFFHETNVTLVHAHQYAPFFYSALSRNFGNSPPIVFTEHGRDFPDEPRMKRIMANRVLLRKNDAIVGVGRCVKAALSKNEQLPENRIQVIYNGVKTSNYDPSKQLREEVRQELRCAASDIVIIQVARLNRLKDHQTAIRAMSLIVKKHENTKLVLIGDGEERSSIDQQVASLGLDDHVIRLGTRRDVPRLLQGADLFTLSSITEGIPLTAIEAMATNLPCVLTRVGGNAEVVTDGETGLLAEPSDPEDLANQLSQMIANSSLRARLAKNGCQSVLQHFDESQMLQGYDELYTEVLTRSGRNPNQTPSPVLVKQNV